MESSRSVTTSSEKTKDLIITSLLISLVFVATFFINIRLPIAANGGLVHLGSAMLFIIAILFGPKKGAMAGAFGMAHRQRASQPGQLAGGTDDSLLQRIVPVLSRL